VNADIEVSEIVFVRYCADSWYRLSHQSLRFFDNPLRQRHYKCVSFVVPLRAEEELGKQQGFAVLSTALEEVQVQDAVLDSNLNDTTRLDDWIGGYDQRSGRS